MGNTETMGRFIGRESRTKIIARRLRRMIGENSLKPWQAQVKKRKYELMRMELNAYKKLCSIMRAMIGKQITYVIIFCLVLITGTLIGTALIVLFTLIHAQ